MLHRYDDPRLWFMYVDKLLRGSRAVQTLGRLARVGGVSKGASPTTDSGPRAAAADDDDGNHPDEDGGDASVVRSRSKAVKVVDFVNMAGSIQESFEEYAGMTQYRTGAPSLMMPGRPHALIRHAWMMVILIVLMPHQVPSCQ